MKIKNDYTFFLVKPDSKNDINFNLHPYPCEFPSSVPREILCSYSKEGMLICDPFVGSGTTLIEAGLQGLDSIGIDINPIACLISRVCATPLDNKKLKKTKDILNKIQRNYKLHITNNSDNLSIFSYDSVNHWFQREVIEDLSFLKKEVALINDEKVRDLLLVSMSAIIVNVSNQESDTRYAAINKNINLGKTITLFMKKSNDLINFHKHFMKKIPRKNVKVKIFQTDTRDLKFIPKNSVDIIITSPPYANTYDYYLYHKHRMRWLSMDVSYAQYNEIGSRREFSSLKESPDKWKNDIARCMRELIRITKKNGLFFIIIGDSIIKSEFIDGKKLLNSIALDLGLKHIHTESTDMKKHSKRFNPSFRASKKKEHLIVYKNKK